jgi:probable HAF family extracellular repeat protein
MLHLEELEPRLLLTQYNLVDLGVDPSGSNYAKAYGINDYGITVGESGTRATMFLGGRTYQVDGHYPSAAYAINDNDWAVGYGSHLEFSSAFIARKFNNETLPNLGSCIEAQAFAINNYDVAAGYACTSPPHAVTWDHRQGNFVTDLGLGEATGINDFGVVVGSSFNSPVYWVNGTVQAIPARGYATAINSQGWIVGTGWLWSDNNITPLPISASSINNYGVIVGGNAKIWENGNTSNLQDLLTDNQGWTLQTAAGINNNGQIVGYGTTPEGYTHAYRLDPVPSPSVYWWLGWARGRENNQE